VSGARRAFAPNAFRGVLIAGTVLIVGAIGVALATGTADELPWGAIIGVLAIMAFAFVAGRRRARAFGPEDES
jgi:LPXTG-motif cell wall-anchored protein